MSAVEPETANAKPVAVWSGIELKLPSGRVLPFLFCSANASMNGFFVESAEPTADDELCPEVCCPRCNAVHFVFRLEDALEGGDLNAALREADPSFRLEELLAIMIRDGVRRPA